MFRRQMQPAELADYPGDGEYIFVANGPVRIVTDRGEVFRLNSRDTANTKGFQSLRIEHTGEIAGLVEIETGHGTYRPGSAGDAVEVVNTVQVEVAAPISIAPDQQVTVNGIVFPSAMTVDGAVDLVPGAEVALAAPVQIDPAAEIYTKAASTATGLPVFVIGVSNVRTVSANATRLELILVADKNNAGVLWLGSETTDNGIPLEPGEKFTYSYFNGSLKVRGSENDRFYALEVLK